MANHAYPIQIERFPTLVDGRVMTDGTLAIIDGKEAYLESELALASVISADVKVINPYFPGRS